MKAVLAALKRTYAVLALRMKTICFASASGAIMQPPINILFCFPLMRQFNAAEVASVVGIVFTSYHIMLGSLCLGKVMAAGKAAGGTLAGGRILIVGMAGADNAAGGALTAAIILFLPLAIAVAVRMGAIFAAYGTLAGGGSCVLIAVGVLTYVAAAIYGTNAIAPVMLMVMFAADAAIAIRIEQTFGAIVRRLAFGAYAATGLFPKNMCVIAFVAFRILFIRPVMRM